MVSAFKQDDAQGCCFDRVVVTDLASQKRLRACRKRFPEPFAVRAARDGERLHWFSGLIARKAQHRPSQRSGKFRLQFLA